MTTNPPIPGLSPARKGLYLFAFAATVAIAWWVLRPEPQESYVRIPYAGTNATANYDPATLFKTPYTTEAGMCVTEILTDLAEMAFRAGAGKAPVPGVVRVAVSEEAGSQRRHPRYRVDVTLGQKSARLSLPVEIIWDHETYREAGRTFLELAGVKLSVPRREADPDSAQAALMGRLLDAEAVTIVNESRRVSQELTRDFLNVGAHEEAAFLHGVLVMKEEAAFFSDPRLGLCRLVAHLTLARCLGGGAPGLAGEAAEAISLAAMKRQVEAVARLGDPAAQPDPAVAAWLRVIRATVTADYRPLSDPASRTPLERVAWLRAYGLSVGIRLALEIWPYAKLASYPDAQRVLREMGPWEFLRDLGRDGMKSELGEQWDVLQAYFGAPAGALPSTDQLNVHPEHCFSTNGEIRVLGWGHWASFFQRHLMNELHGRYEARRWYGGWDSDVKSAEEQIRTQYSALLLQPLLLQQIRTNWMTRPDRLDEAIAMSRTHPEIIPSILWGRLQPVYEDTNLRMRDQVRVTTEEWFRHYPLPGTALVLYEPFLDYGMHGKVTDVPLLDELGRMAPYDFSILNLRDYPRWVGSFGVGERERVSPDQTKEYWEPLSGYMLTAMWEMAELKRGDPKDYERRLLEMIRLAPTYNIDLGQYFFLRNEPDKALPYFEAGFTNRADSERLSKWVRHVVELELDAGRVEKAEALADEAIARWAHQGFSAKARIHERAGRLAEALALYEQVEQNYSEPDPLIGFCTRNAVASVGTPEEPRIFAALERLRPKECVRVSVADFHGPPGEREGVDIIGPDPRITYYGLKGGDVVVGVDGWRTRTGKDFDRVLKLSIGSRIRLIVWDWSGYREVVCEDSDRLEGFPFGSVSPRRKP